MTETEALSALFECAPGTRFDLDQLDRMFGGKLAALIGEGLLIEAEPARRVPCNECGEVHDIAVENDATGRQWGFCVEGGGWIEIDPETLRRFRFDQAAFLHALTLAMGLEPKIKSLVDGVCWRLGAVRANAAMPVVARGLEDAEGLMLACAAFGRYRAWSGLVICGFHPPDLQAVLPRGFGVRTFAQLIALDTHGAISCDQLEVADALKTRPRGRGAHGAPWNHPKLAPLITARFRSGERQTAAAAEARWLLAHPVWARLGKPPPSAKTLAKFIGGLWKTLSATNSR